MKFGSVNQRSQMRSDVSGVQRLTIAIAMSTTNSNPRACSRA